VPASFTVNGFGDAGAGTGTTGDLRYCIHQAKISADTSSTINFNTSLSGTIDLGSSLDALNNKGLPKNLWVVAGSEVQNPPRRRVFGRGRG
jgi:hypothetical protein